MSAHESPVRALVLTGFGINCDNETQYALTRAGASADRIHINRLIELSRQGRGLADYQILAVDGGFSWADDHGAGVLLGVKLNSRLGDQIQGFIEAGKLIIGICNGFQALVNMGLLPGFDGDYRTRSVALAANDCGNFRDDWVHLSVDPGSKCVFTRGIESIDLPIRHGEGKFFAPPELIERLRASGQVAMRYAKPDYTPEEAIRRYRGSPSRSPEYHPAQGAFPYNPNGSLDDIAGICDGTGRIFGLMPHPEGFHHRINHPDWGRLQEQRRRKGLPPLDGEGDGLKIFQNAVNFVRENLL